MALQHLLAAHVAHTYLCTCGTHCASTLVIIAQMLVYHPALSFAIIASVVLEWLCAGKRTSRPKFFHTVTTQWLVKFFFDEYCTWCTNVFIQVATFQVYRWQ